ncbi:hypothetical protein H4582DRAFT_580352 [Lactarius indigo]|nr:hypothetical protein H4582DRAFT_580352 [Lactarius indigo]
MTIMVLLSFISWVFSFLFLYLYCFPLSYFGDHLQGRHKQWYYNRESVVFWCGVRCYRTIVARHAVKRSREWTLNKVATDNTSCVSELNGLRKNNSAVV